MKTTFARNSTAPAADERLAQLIDELTDRLQAGESVDISAFSAAHREYADQLIRWYTAMAALVDLGTSVGPGKSPGGEPLDAETRRLGTLGDFQIVQEIGRGGMGVVYEAEQISLGRRVALKVLPFAAMLDTRQLQRFKNEAQAAANLKHPHIVGVYSVGCERGVHFYAMELVEGHSLAELIGQLRRGLSEFSRSENGTAPLPASGPGSSVEGEGSSVESEGSRVESPESRVESPELKGNDEPVASRSPERDVESSATASLSSSAPLPTSPPPSDARRHVVSDNPATAETLPIAALSTEHDTNSPAYFRTVAQLGIQAAEALEYAHQLGIVHRDIKPSNLMVEEGKEGKGVRNRFWEGKGVRNRFCEAPAGPSRKTVPDTFSQSSPHLWITDFGLAQVQSDNNLTMTGDLLGTLRYMSPEQASGRRAILDHRTDIYSLCVTLYELATLRPAFPETDRVKLLQHILEAEPPAPRTKNAAIPRDLETIIVKATAKEPTARYASAQELADDLKRFVENRPIIAKPPTFAVRIRKWVGRHSALTAAAGVVLVLAVVGLTITTLLVNSEAERAKDNLDLALLALDETLIEAVAGRLIVEYDELKRSELERRGIAFYEEFAEKNGVDPKSWPTYRMLVCNKQLRGAIALRRSDNDAARTSFEAALDEASALVAHSERDVRYQSRLINCLVEFADFLGEHGDLPRAEELSSRAETLAVRLCKKHPEFAPGHYLLGANRYNIGLRHFKVGRMDDAARSYQAAIAPLEKAFFSEKNEIRNPQILARCRYNLALVLGLGGKTEEAEQQWTTSLGLWKKLILMDPTVSEFHSCCGGTLGNLAALARARDEISHCRVLAEEALVHQKRAIRVEPVYPPARDSLGQHYRQLSIALTTLCDHAALAAVCDERVKYLGENHEQWRAAAESLADCSALCQQDEQLSAAERAERADHHAAGALALLADAQLRFAQDTAALHRIAFAYAMVGEKLAAIELHKHARQAWQSTDTLLREFRFNFSDKDADEIDQYIEFNRQRLQSIPASKSPPDDQSAEDAPAFDADGRSRTVDARQSVDADLNQAGASAPISQPGKDE